MPRESIKIHLSLSVRFFRPPRNRWLSPSLISRNHRSSYDDLGRKFSLCFGGEITQDLTSMRALLLIISTLLRYGAAFFRSRNEHVFVELALRQQLTTFSQKGSKPSSRLWIVPYGWHYCGSGLAGETPSSLSSRTP